MKTQIQQEKNGAPPTLVDSKKQQKWNETKNCAEFLKIAEEGYRVSLSNKGNTLLWGNIFCGHCGGRLTPSTSDIQPRQAQPLFTGSGSAIFAITGPASERSVIGLWTILPPP